MRRTGDAPLPASADSLDTLIAAQEGLEIDRLAGGFFSLIPPANSNTFATKDPYRNKDFDRAAYVYAERDGFLRRIAVVHHAPDDRVWAQKLARLSARLIRVARDRFGRWPTFQGGAEEARIWLFRDPVGGIAGGETRGGQVYVYDTATIPNPLEWVRTLCHEWGHLTLPAARGYSAPENDAGGMVGERLFLAWLAADKPGGPDDGTRSSDLAMYCQRQCEPLVARFLSEGPASSGFDKRDARAMDLYVGSILATDRSLGSAVLGEALRGIDGVAPRDFLNSLKTTAYRQKNLTVQLPTWVPVAPLSYRLSASRGAGQLLVNGQSLKVPGPFKPGRAAFALLRGSGSLTGVTLTRLGALS